MIAPRKIIYMTRAARIESGEGEKELKISEYSGADYVLLRILKSFFLGSIAFAGLCALWLCSNWNSLNEIFFDADYMGFARHILIAYIIFMIVYLLIIGIVSLLHYRKCSRKRKKYLAILERI